MDANLNQFLKWAFSQDPRPLFLDSVANILGYFIHLDVHKISCKMKDDNDIEPIRLYFLDERGFKILYGIWSIANNPEVAFYNKDLALLLIDILNIFLKLIKMESAEDTTLEQQIDDIKSCFLLLTDLDFKNDSFLNPAKLKSMIKGDKMKAGGNNSTVRSSHYLATDSDDSDSILDKSHHEYEPKPSSNKSKVFNDGDMEIIKELENQNSNENDDKSIKENQDKSNKLYQNLNHDKLLSQISASVNLAGAQTLLESDADTLHDVQNLFTNVPINSSFLSYIIISIINENLIQEQLSIQSQDSLNCISYPHVSFAVIETLSSSLNLLTKENFSNYQSSKVFNQLIRLLFIASCSLAQYKEGLMAIESRQTLNKLMFIAHLYYEMNNQFFIDIVFGLIYLLTCSAQSLTWTQEFPIMIVMVSTFIATRSGQLILNSLRFNMDESLGRICYALSLLMSSLQRTKILFAHHERCKLKKHTRCNLRNLLFHHHIILGQEFSSTKPSCCISLILSIFLDILPLLNTVSEVLLIMRQLGSISFCCCFNIHNAFESLLILAQRFKKLEVCKLILSLIVNISESFDPKLDCCKHKLTMVIHATELSNLTESQNVWASKCQIASFYENLLHSEEPIRNLVAKHLSLIIKNEHQPLWHCLSQNITQPLFLPQSSTKEEINISLNLLCQALVNQHACKIFINTGLDQLINFLEDPASSTLAHQALENLIKSELVTSESVQDLSLSPALSAFLKLLNDASLNTSSDFSKVTTLPSDLNLNKSFNFYSNQASSIPTDQENNCDDIYSLFYLNNIWTVHSKFCFISTEYISTIRSSYPQLIISSYQLFESILKALFDQSTLSQMMVIQSQTKAFNFIEIIRLLELIIPSLLCMTPFSIDSNQITNESILSLLKSKILQIETLVSDNKEDFLKLIIKMLINSSFHFIQTFKDAINDYFRLLSKESNFKFNNSSELLSPTLSESDSSSQSGDNYEADDECCEWGQSFKIKSALKYCSFKSHYIHHGSCCTLAIEILIAFCTHKWSRSAIKSTFKMLLDYCRESDDNRKTLYHLNLATLTLEGFYFILTKDSAEYRAVHSAIFDFLLELCSKQLNGKELKLFLMLFKPESAPINLLIQVFSDLINAEFKEYLPKPLYSLQFTTEGQDCGTIIQPQSSESRSEAWINEMKAEAETSDFRSGWSHAAFALPIPQYKNISLLKFKKFALTVWLYIQKPKIQFDLVSKFITSQASHQFQIHILTLSFDTLSVEIWLDLKKLMFHFRSIEVTNGCYSLISEVLRPSHVNFSGHWHHICFNFEELKKPQLTDAPLLINYIIDGFKEETIAINHGCPKPTVRSCILAGTSSNLPLNVLAQIGNIISFKTRLTRSHCLYLYLLGPDFCDFTSCQISETQKMLENLRLFKHSAINKSLLQEYSKLSNPTWFVDLQDNIFLTFQPHLYTYFLIYSSVSSDSFLIPIATSSRFFTPKSSSSNLANTLEVSHSQTIIFSHMRMYSSSRFSQALTEVGGIGVLIFFFAKMIEITSSEKVQARALQILLNVCEIHFEIFNSFIYEFNGFAMINLAIESISCSISKKIFETYLSFCLNSLDTKQSIIICPVSFAHLVMAWRAWHKSTITIACLYSTIKNLISEENPFREFNLMQMTRSHVIDTLLTMLQDTFIQIDESNLLVPYEVAKMLPEIIQTSITATPFNLSLLTDLVDCILLLHQASNTYVSHSRSSFYFLFYSNWRTSCINSKNCKNLELQTQSASSFDDLQTSSTEEDLYGSLDRQKEIFNLVMTGLIEVIGNAIRKAPSSILDKILGHIVKPEIFLVLAHNEDEKVREEVLKCFIYCLKRGKGTECINTFLNKFGLHLLSNQLHQHQTTKILINLSLNLLWDIDFNDSFSTEIDTSNEVIKLEPDQWCYFVILLSLLPNSVYNKTLCHTALSALQKCFETISNPCSLFKYLFENGFIECLAKILIEWEKAKQSSSAVLDGYEADLIVDDVYKIFYTISHFLFDSNGSQFTSIYFQIIDLLSTFERHSRKDVKLWFRESVIISFEAALECIEGYLSNVYKTKEDRTSTREIQDLSFPASLIFPLPESSTSVSYSSFRMSTEASHNIDVVKENRDHLSNSEINSRFQKFIKKAVNYLICKENKIFSIEREKFCSRSLLHLILQAIKFNKKPSTGRRRTVWTLMIGSSKEMVKNTFSKFILHLLSPLQKYNERIFSYSVILKNVDKFGVVFKTDFRFIELVEAFLKDLELSSEDVETKNSITQFLNHIKSRLDFGHKSGNLYKDVISDWFAELDREASLSQNACIDDANFNRLNNLFQKVAESAMNITRDAVEYQNHERKQFINHLKMSSSERYSIRKSWKNLIEMFTHEKSIWYYPESFPQSWELDPTEGPQRIRRRLRRCNLEIADKFFQPEYQKKSSLGMTTNLAYIFQQDIHESDFSALIDRLHTNERILYTTTCVIVAPTCEYAGEILIGDTCIYFVGEQNNSVFGSSVFTELWMFNEIKQINKCRYQLQNNAIEMFLINGLSFLISFETKLACEDFLKILMQRNLPNLKEDKSLVAAIQLWREGSITNFEYLTHLNKLSGRSFNDLMQYPVFPFILADYESEKLNLKLPQSFRNLSKPVAVQRKEREKYFINQYNYLKDEHERASSAGDMLPTTGPYHFGSHYSNSGTVLHFLVRLPPFTQMFLTYQDNSFDLPDRTFHSISTSWRLASGDSTTDFKELTPEFFFLPEFLINSEKFNFGRRQNGEMVDDVKLPLWCRNDARLFVLIHRQALESHYVSSTLNEWVDLIFGYKQTGKAAIDAINVFHPATYYGFDTSKFEDPLKAKALQTMIKTFGQMPRQLFTAPHPSIMSDKKSDESKNITHEINEVIGLKWGNYIGSPSEPTPFVIFRKKNSIQIESFLMLANNDVFGLEVDTCSLLTYSRQKSGALFNSDFVISHSLISWNHFDNIIRIKHSKGSPAIPLVSGNFILDKVTKCATTSGRNTLLVGYKSGAIAVYTLSQTIKTKIELKKSKNWLYGHYGPVTCIKISKEFNVAVSGGQDGSCILWDLNKMCYVRTVAGHLEKVIALEISPTLGDIASLSEADSISLLRVNTINGSLVGELKSQDQITAMCYSSAPEGISINSIVTGHSNGVIKFWCSWDLSPIRELRDDKFTLPIKCIAFTYDNQQLCAANNEGIIIVWGKGNSRKNILIVV